jgi:hypothetical protein
MNDGRRELQGAVHQARPRRSIRCDGPDGARPKEQRVGTGMNDLSQPTDGFQGRLFLYSPRAAKTR